MTDPTTQPYQLARHHLLWCMWQREERARELAMWRRWVQSLREIVL